MSYTKMFLDDERHPPLNFFNGSPVWLDLGVIARSSTEAIDWVKRHGIPNFISFDHDLGGEDTAVVFINWMIEEVLDNHLAFPSDFQYYVHSQNPIGKKNIEGKLNSFLRTINT